MNTIVQLLKETCQLIFGISLLGLMVKLFFKRTLVGRILAVVFKDFYLYIKLCLKIVKHTGKYTYKTGIIVNKYLKKKLGDDTKKGKETNKKVVNGSNIIDFKTAKQLRYKWNK